MHSVSCSSEKLKHLEKKHFYMQYNGDYMPYIELCVVLSCATI